MMALTRQPTDWAKQQHTYGSECAHRPGGRVRPNAYEDLYREADWSEV